jgi:hypothetical protein
MARVSSHRNVKMRVIAQEIIDDGDERRSDADTNGR